MLESDKLTISDYTFVVFIDETGDDKCADPRRPVFGFGGCGVLGVNLELFIHAPWRAVRQKIHGSAETPLHAAEMPRPHNDEHMLALGLFFARTPFVHAS